MPKNNKDTKLMLKKKLFIQSQYLLPQHLLSRLAGLFTNCKVKWFKNAFIKWFIQHYQVNMQEAIFEHATDYESFNAFFTRKLKPNARPFNKDNHSIICPVDGSISQLGQINDTRIFQAKGFDFTTEELLGGQTQLAKKFHNGLFATLYLSPKDYHCIHMPFTGKLTRMIYIPGDLFSVNQTTVANVPRLFARNERVVCLFETSFGPMAVVLVGAFFVASIHTAWAGKITPPHGKAVTTTDYQDQDIRLSKGDLLGHFELGSTVVMLLPNKVADFDKRFTESYAINMGINMANLTISET